MLLNRPESNHQRSLLPIFFRQRINHLVISILEAYVVEVLERAQEEFRRNRGRGESKLEQLDDWVESGSEDRFEAGRVEGVVESSNRDGSVKVGGEGGEVRCDDTRSIHRFVISRFGPLCVQGVTSQLLIDLNPRTPPKLSKLLTGQDCEGPLIIDSPSDPDPFASGLNVDYFAEGGEGCDKGSVFGWVGVCFFDEVSGDEGGHFVL